MTRLSENASAGGAKSGGKGDEPGRKIYVVVLTKLARHQKGSRFTGVAAVLRLRRMPYQSSTTLGGNLNIF